MSEGSEEQVENKIQQYLKKLRDSARLETGQLSVMDKTVRWAVEAERKGTEREQCKKVRFGGEEQSEETGAQTTDEPEVVSGFEEVRTGRGNAGLVQGEDERCRGNEASRKGKGKGREGKGEHGKEGGQGGKGVRQKMPSEEDEEDERTVVAPNTGAGGSHPRATRQKISSAEEESEARQESGH